MTIKILYFAGLREALGLASEDIPLPENIATVGALHAHLVARGGVWTSLAQAKNLRIALNQNMVVSENAADAALKEGDEVAFFPPVTGG